MAPKRPFSEDDFNCPVCRDVFRDPVILTCSHSFCKRCVERSWEAKGTRECPVCRVTEFMDSPVQNLILKTLCENLRNERKKAAVRPQCSLHGKALEFFSTGTGEVMCVVCRDSATHTSNFRPIEDVALDAKDELKKKVTSLQEKLEAFDKTRQLCIQIAQHIKVQANDAVQTIKAEFSKLHVHLHTTEYTRISALRQEEVEKSHLMEQTIETLRRDATSIAEKIQCLEEQMETADASIVLNYKSTLDRAQCTLQDPDMVSGALINVAKHLGNLRLEIWKSVLEDVEYTPVILDPNTAEESMKVSQDLTVVGDGDPNSPPIPDNPERFTEDFQVLGSEGFSSGVHSWTVVVQEDNDSWEVGVMEESTPRKGWSRRDGSVALCYSDLEHEVSYPGGSINLTLSHELRKVTVTLDLDRGELTFFDAENNTHIHTIQHTFTGKVYPCFYSGFSSLKLLKMKVAVREWSYG